MTQERQPATAAPKVTRDPAGTLENIMAVATHEFAAKGFDGARVDAIAEATRTSKRMIYYHFDGKEGLYLAVLEAAYARIRQIESQLHLDDLGPLEALRALVGFTHDYHLEHQDFVRLVMTENINNGVFLARSKVIQSLNVSAIDALRSVVRRGVAAGVFRDGLDPVDLHRTISALSFYNVSNRATFSLIFERDVDAPESVAARRASMVDTVVRAVVKWGHPALPRESP